ncbi:MAG: DNA polymerase III subunit gamma/tau [Bdellovibrionota bacterium]
MQNYVVLARRYRPQQLSDLVGQQAVTKTLANAIALGRVPHAMVFTGTRGVGKTTAARIMAKALNCEKGPTASPCGVCSNCVEVTSASSVDVLEIDGASNTSVDDVRQLIENVQYAPSKSRYKIYIIDEVHMLSTSAFNALLKTLEEPPSGVFFLFATTEVHKIPETILSRCSRFDFRHISETQIFEYLKEIMKKENLEVDDEALRIVAKQGDGSLRDALSMLDQVIAFSEGKITGQQVAESLGLTDRALIVQSIESFVNYDATEALQILSKVFSKGFDVKNYLLEVLEKIRHMLLLKAGVSSDLIAMSEEELAWLREKAQASSESELERWFDLLKNAISWMGRVEFPRYLLEVTFIRMTRKLHDLPITDLLDRLEQLEKKISTGTFDRGTSPAVSPSRSSSGVVPTTSTSHQPTSTQPAASTSSGAFSWDGVVDQIKKEKPGTAAILVQGKVLESSSTKITLEYEAQSFYYTRASEREFGLYVTSTAQKLFGCEPLVEIKSRDGQAQKADQDAEKKKQQEKAALKDPMLEKAVTLFGATVEEVRSIEE